LSKILFLNLAHGFTRNKLQRNNQLRKQSCSTIGKMHKRNDTAFPKF